MKVLVHLICWFALVNVGLCCKCKVLTQEEKYCQSEFVLLARVNSALINPNEQPDFDDFYHIKVQKIYKFPKSKVKMSRVYTASDSAACGVKMEKGNVYLMSGTLNLVKNRLEINNCISWIEKTPLSKSSKMLLSHPPSCD